MIDSNYTSLLKKKMLVFFHKAGGENVEIMVNLNRIALAVSILKLL